MLSVNQAIQSVVKQLFLSFVELLFMTDRMVNL